MSEEFGEGHDGAIDPTVESPTPTPTEPGAPRPPQVPPPAAVEPASGRLELVALLLTVVVAIQVLAFVVALFDDDFELGDRFRLSSEQLEVRLSLVLVIAVLLIVTVPFRGEREAIGSRGRQVLMGAAVLGAVIAVIALIGIGLDLADSDRLGRNAFSQFLLRMSSFTMAVVAAGWALSALGVRITTATSR